jgi:hypothetical protein
MDEYGKVKLSFQIDLRRPKRLCSFFFPVIFVIVISLFFSQSLRSQTLENASNALIGKISKDGRVYDKHNHYMGCFRLKDGAIHDGNNRYIGKISSSHMAYDRVNVYLGKIDADGRVYDRNNAFIGKIDSFSIVHNRNNARIGSAKGVNRDWAAVAFFFGLFKFE